MLYTTMNLRGHTIPVWIDTATDTIYATASTIGAVGIVPKNVGGPVYTPWRGGTSQVVYRIPTEYLD